MSASAMASTVGVLGRMGSAGWVIGEVSGVRTVTDGLRDTLNMADVLQIDCAACQVRKLLRSG